MNFSAPDHEEVLAEFIRRGLADSDIRIMRAKGVVRTGRVNRRAIELPYPKFEGGWSDFSRFRCLDDLEPKYLQDRGTGAHVYFTPGVNWPAIAAAGDLVGPQRVR